MTALTDVPPAPATGDGHQQTRALASWLLGLPIACMLIASAVAHIGNPYRFLAAIYAYELVPAEGAELLAALLPFLNLTIAICLITGQAQRPAFRAGFFLFLLYAGAQAATLVRGLKVDCGCFGPSEMPKPIGAMSIGLVVGSAFVCLLGWWVAQVECRKPEVLDTPSEIGALL